MKCILPRRMIFWSKTLFSYPYIGRTHVCHCLDLFLTFFFESNSTIFHFQKHTFNSQKFSYSFIPLFQAIPLSSSAFTMNFYYLFISIIFHISPWILLAPVLFGLSFIKHGQSQILQFLL